MRCVLQYRPWQSGAIDILLELEKVASGCAAICDCLPLQPGNVPRALNDAYVLFQPTDYTTMVSVRKK